ncbi:hypothetical protein COU54_05310 [Candidatus Pacearchaeota archaeon CG10_big_fil_rev_8_21_14_0_10_31_24]|nr:MAG: hypothetical protein COU54_05310 [Candidatus Pacearchaeota archaeon CG10_big_fil_rev_8_21_14_0_10_31_24]
MNLAKSVLWILIGILTGILVLWGIRVFSHSELDDVTLGIQCDESLLMKSDVLWIIPKFENKSISDNLEWCSHILSLNKTLGLHGIEHQYKEFEGDIDEDYLNLGIGEFESCFGFKPKIFKAPQLALSLENKKMVESFGMKVYENFNQIIHKVYHCSDSGRFSNKLIEKF